MRKSKNYLVIVCIVILSLLIVANLLIQNASYLVLSFLIIGCIMVPFFVRFEMRRISSREIVLLAMLATVAAVSRVPFVSLPSIQPTSFVIIMTGLVFGAESGFIVGAVAAIVSNIFLGQGPWTPWQMFGWGMMGMSAGLVRNTWWIRKKIGLSIFGFVWGYIFGWLMNMWIILSNVESFSWSYFLSIYTSSIFFDLAHGLSNVFFLLLFATSWMKILNRFKRKYGLLTTET